MNLVAPSRTRPWYMTGVPRSGRNPFQHLGRDYCLHCKMDVDVDTEAHMQGTTYAYRVQCGRCGRFINWGWYNQVAVLSGPSSPLLKPDIKACEWIFERGHDRS